MIFTSMSDGGMNKKLKILLAIILLPLSVVIPVMSMDSHYYAQTSAQAADSSLAARIQEYKDKLKAEVTKTQQDRLKLGCSVVQANIKNLDGKLGDVKTAHTEAYDNILKSLNDLLAKLDAQGYNSTDLQAAVSVLSDKIDAFKTEMDSYKQAADDLTVIDCTQDPTSFKAALESARASHDSLGTSVSDIRTYIANTIKPLLKTTRTQIESGDNTGGTQ